MTTFKLFLTTIACTDVVKLENTPSIVPIGVVEFDNLRCCELTPRKKPKQTIATDPRTVEDDRVESSRYEKRTVKGRTRPRAT